jgi:hypothetical protein
MSAELDSLKNELTEISVNGFTQQPETESFQVHVGMENFFSRVNQVLLAVGVDNNSSPIYKKGEYSKTLGNVWISRSYRYPAIAEDQIEILNQMWMQRIEFPTPGGTGRGFLYTQDYYPERPLLYFSLTPEALLRTIHQIGMIDETEEKRAVTAAEMQDRVRQFAGLMLVEMYKKTWG